MRNILLMVSLLTIILSCSETNEPLVDNEFSIYMVKDTTNNSPYEVSINNLILEEEPVISLNDIISYSWDIHQIEFSDDAKERLKLKEPLYGKYFVLSASNQRMYWGIFIFDICSSTINRPVINIPSTLGMSQSYLSNSFRIDRAYPVYLGNEDDPDIRENEIIYNVLKQSGKLN